jgi:hypothetical protein
MDSFVDAENNTSSDNIVCKTAAQLPTPSESPGTFPGQHGSAYGTAISEIHHHVEKAPSGNLFSPESKLIMKLTKFFPQTP